MSDTQSPSIGAPIYISFPEAITAVIEGKRITKREWNNAAEYGMLRDGFLMLRRNGQWHQWIISDGDLRGIDWMAME